MRAANLISSLATSLVVVASAPAWPKDVEPSKDDGSVFEPTFSAGLSRPLVLSVSGGVLLPFGKWDRTRLYPDVFGLRADVDLGLGGGSVSAGAYIPLGESLVMNLKGSRLRTWLATWDAKKDRTYDGVVAELVLIGHIPLKVGIGHFKDREAGDNRFTYWFAGFGW